MKLKDFDFDLPLELIAQEPNSQRDHSKMLVIPESDDGDFISTSFFNLPDYLQAGDLIVFNNSKVINAKFILEKQDKKIQCYLNKPISPNIWLGFAKPSRKLQDGDEFVFGDHCIIIKKKLDMGQIEIEFRLKDISVFEFCALYGHIPLPPYIKRSQERARDKEQYQTVYSEVLGSVAAHTAGLHFTKELLNKLLEKQVEFAHLTLHIGAGTFLPVKCENISEHSMHKEYYEISTSAAVQINKAKSESRRVIAVGTTTVRTIESNVVEGSVRSGSGETDIFITPGFKFQIIDMLISNFHLPKSTLFMLLCAFVGYDKAFQAYRYAITNKMRFFSYGDATLSYLNKEKR